jgi:hypothetical protein
LTNPGGDTTIANFSELATAVGSSLSASAAGGNLQAYVISLAGNTGALGTGTYVLVNNNNTSMDTGDLMIQLIGSSVAPVAGDFII